jgi:DHA1 family bicyclomycin/chloramphenicol resistance-like MFS transporter
MLRPDSPAMTLLLGALVAMGPLAMDIYLVSMPTMTGALGATVEQVQLTLSVYMYGWGIGQLVVGSASDRWGRRPVLLAGLAVAVLAATACALARDVHTLIAARFVQALGMAAVFSVPRAVVRDLFSAERAARVLSLMGIILSIAPIVAPLIGSHLHVWLGWQANFALVAIYGAAALAFSAARLPETIRSANPGALAPRAMLSNFATLMRSRQYVGYVLVAALASSGLFAFLAGGSFVFVSVMGAGEREFGMLFGSVMTGNIVGAVLASRTVMRHGINALLRVSTAVMLAAGAALAALAWAGINHPAAVVVPMFVFMAAFTATIPQATAGALTPFPRIAGAAASLLSFCQFTVASTWALAVGFAYDGTQRPMATAIAAAAVLAFSAFWLVVRPARGATPPGRAP